MKHSGKASGSWEVWELRLAINWSKFGVKENLKLQNHSHNDELSENDIKMTFFLISGQKIIMKGCARRNSQVASRYRNIFFIFFGFRRCGFVPVSNVLAIFVSDWQYKLWQSFGSWLRKKPVLEEKFWGEAPQCRNKTCFGKSKSIHQNFTLECEGKWSTSVMGR